MHVIGSTTGSAGELINAIVQQIVVSIKASLAEMKRTTGAKSPRAAALRRKSSTDQLVQEVSRKLFEFARAQDRVCMSEREVESSLASTVSEAMTAAIQALESGSDDQETKGKWAKRSLARIKRAVPALMCQCASSNVPMCQCACSTGVISDVEGEKEVKEVRRESQRPEQSIKTVSSEEFHSKAKKAVSDVLIGELKTLHSAPRAPSSDSTGAGSEASSSRPQPVEEAATILIETFVDEMKKVAQSAEYADEPVSPDDHLLSQTPGVSGVKKKETVQLAAAKIYGQVQMTLKDFFKRLPIQQSQRRATTLRTEDPQQSDSLAPDVHSAGDEQEAELPASSRSEQALPVAEAQSPVDIGEVRSVSGCPLTPLQLAACTRNVLKGVVASYLSGPERTSSREQEASPELPAAKSSLLEGVIVQLEDMAGSNSHGCNEDDPSKLTGTDVTGGLSKPCSLTSLRRLSSVEFQMNAFESVTNVLVASVRSYSSLKSYASDIDKDEFRGVPWNDFSSKDVDAVVTEIVNQFVSDIQTHAFLASPSPDPVDACSSEAEPQSWRSKLALSDKPFISSASKMYENLLGKVGKFFAQCSIRCNAPGKQRTDDEHEMDPSLNTNDATTQSNNDTVLANPLSHREDVTNMADLDGCTRDMMSELLTVLDEESAKEDTENRSATVTTDMMVDPSIHRFADGEHSDKSAEKDCSVSLTSITEMIEEFCSESVQMNAVKQVSEVLLHSAINLSRPSSSLQTEHTACQVVKAVVEGVQHILESTSSCVTKDNTCSDIKGDSVPSSQCNERTREDLNIQIWTTIRRMFSTSLRKVKDLFRTSQPLYSKTTCKSYAHAKEVISKALLRIRGSLLKSGDLDSLDNLSFVKEIINNILVNIGEAQDHAGPEQTATDLERPASASSKWSESSSNSSSENFSGVVTVTEGPTEGAAEGQTHTDVSVKDTDGPHACITQQAVASVVKMVKDQIDLENGGNSSLQTQGGGLNSVDNKLEESLSHKAFNSLTDDFVDEIYGLFRSSNRTAARKSASDSVLLELGHCSASKRRLVSQLIHVYSEETVKHYLLPHFNLPSSRGVSQGGLLRPASAPVRCPGNSSSSETPVNGQATTKGPRTPSKVLCDIMGLVIKSMVKDVMSSLEDRLGQPLKPVHENLLGTQSSAASLQEAGSDGHEDATALPFPKSMPVDSDNYAGLVTLLVVRLMMKIEGQGLQSEDMLDKSRQLIDKILYVFDIVSGSSRTDPFPLSVRVHRVFRTIYGDLLGEFGTEEALSKVMDADDASFEKTLVTSITKQLLRMCDEASGAPPTLLNKDVTEDQADSSVPVTNKKCRKGILRFLPRIPKLKIFQKVKSLLKKKNIHFFDCLKL